MDRETMRDQLRDRMRVLLQESDDPQAEMFECSDLIFEWRGWGPQTDSQKIFLDDLFSDPTGRELADLAIGAEVDPANAETPTDLIHRVMIRLPSDGHLE
jgi:hypothetical protein